MNRRRALAALTLAAAELGAPLVRAQKIHRIGFLANDPSIPTTAAGKAFTEGLRDHGLVEGRNIIIERRFAEGKVGGLTQLANELVATQPELIVVSSNAAVLAAKQATQSTPIVMMNVLDPVALGIVSQLGSPKGNITGLINDVSPQITSKRLQLLKDALPRTSRIAVVMNPESPGDRLQWELLQRIAPSLGVTLRVFYVRQGSELAVAFMRIAASRPDALLGINSGILLAYRRVLIALAAEHRIPAMYAFTECSRDGGLMSYAANRPDIYRRSADYVAKILNGAKPADLPIEQPSKYELVINMQTAKALGLFIPPTVVLRADEVIE